jgi:peptidyl-prolyl cis-trans isomerase C
LKPDNPQTSYAMLRTALAMFQQPPADLDEPHLQQVRQRVNGELAIGQRLLQQHGGVHVMIPDASVHQALKQLVDGFESEAAFDSTLDYNGLNRDSLREALRYDLSVEAAMEQLVRSEAQVSEAEAEIYYLQHRERFILPETRSVCHILITINDDYPENSRERAMQRIMALHNECANDGSQLKALAQCHSECPSAMKDGLIGRVKQGQLYPQLDAALFAMAEGAVSEVIESEIGLHLLYCEQVHAATTLPFYEVKEKIAGILEQKKRSSLLKQWLQK